MRFYQPEPYGANPETAFFGEESPWQESSLSSVVDLNDPDFRYIADAITLMRLAGLDVTDPEILRLAVDAGHRKAASVRDDTTLLGHDVEARRWSRITERDIELPGSTRSAMRVYYARMGNRVKIGWTSDLARRMSNIQPEELMATEPGGPAEEQERHEQFKTFHVVGEWFRYEGSLVEHIDRLRMG